MCSRRNRAVARTFLLCFIQSQIRSWSGKQRSAASRPTVPRTGPSRAAAALSASAQCAPIHYSRTDGRQNRPARRSHLLGVQQHGRVFPNLQPCCHQSRFRSVCAVANPGQITRFKDEKRRGRNKERRVPKQLPKGRPFQHRIFDRKLNRAARRNSRHVAKGSLNVSGE